jgi:hypothetical protein
MIHIISNKSLQNNLENKTIPQDSNFRFKFVSNLWTVRWLSDDYIMSVKYMQ